MKLSNKKREEIIEEVLSRRFDDREAAIRQKAAAHCEYSVKREVEGKPFKAVEGYYSVTKDAAITDAPGETYWANKDYTSIDVKLLEQYPQKVRSSRWIFRDSIAVSICREMAILVQEREDAIEALSSVLNSVSTTKQLHDILPELDSIIEKVCAVEPQQSLVAVETITAVRGLIQ